MFITEEEFRAAESRDKYLRGRWPYWSAAIDMAQSCDLGLGRVLEIGAHHRIYKGSTVLDINPKTATVIKDAGVTPWPFPDKYFDLCIGLQVWEHLYRGAHPAPFLESMRVARSVLLSFPVYWNVPGNSMHHDIKLRNVAQWCNRQEPDETRIVGLTTSRPRMLCLWR
jgi:hypothetical protein